MSDYKKMYLNLFNSVTDAISILQESAANNDYKNLITGTTNAIQVLQNAHVKSENTYIETFDEQSPVQSAEVPGSDDAR
jgi:hypothetical protein